MVRSVTLQYHRSMDEPADMLLSYAISEIAARCSGKRKSAWILLSTRMVLCSGSSFSACFKASARLCSALRRDTSRSLALSPRWGIVNVTPGLRGDTGVILSRLREEMQGLAAQLKFEEAHELKKKYDLVERYRSKSVIVSQVLVSDQAPPWPTQSQCTDRNTSTRP